MNNKKYANQNKSGKINKAQYVQRQILSCIYVAVTVIMLGKKHPIYLAMSATAVWHKIYIVFIFILYYVIPLRAVNL
jgi:hypothetical protein